MNFDLTAANASLIITSPALYPLNLPFQASLIPIIFTSLIYAVILIGVTWKSAPKFNAHIKDTSRRQFANLVLTVHTSLSLLEVVRWHIRSLSTYLPQADVMDLSVCVVQSLTSLWLVKYSGKGVPVMTRPLFQALAVLRLILTVSSWMTVNPALYKASIRGINAFIYARVLIGGTLVMQHSDILPKTPYNIVYNLMSFVGFFMAFGDGALSHGAIWYSLLVLQIAVLNHWVTKEADLKDLSMPRKFLRDSLIHLGFAELRILKASKAGQSFNETPKEARHTE